MEGNNDGQSPSDAETGIAPQFDVAAKLTEAADQLEVDDPQHALLTELAGDLQNVPWLADSVGTYARRVLDAHDTQGRPTDKVSVKAEKVRSTPNGGSLITFESDQGARKEEMVEFPANTNPPKPLDGEPYFTMYTDGAPVPVYSLGTHFRGTDAGSLYLNAETFSTMMQTLQASEPSLIAA